MTEDVSPTTAAADPAIYPMTRSDGWAGIIGAWLAEVNQRVGIGCTATEYGRYVAHFAQRLADQGRILAGATLADWHAFAYVALPDRRLGGP